METTGYSGTPLAKKITDITEDVVRGYVLKTGLVDIKCAVDNIWSGLKLVISVKDRK